MADVRYEKLDRIREDIKRDKAKVAKLQEQIKVKEAKLKEAEASQIVADVGAMNMTPEQLGEFLALIQSGNLNELLSGKTKVVTTVNSSEVNEEENEDLYEDEEDENIWYTATDAHVLFFDNIPSSIVYIGYIAFNSIALVTNIIDSVNEKLKKHKEESIKDRIKSLEKDFIDETL